MLAERGQLSGYGSKGSLQPLLTQGKPQVLLSPMIFPGSAQSSLGCHEPVSKTRKNPALRFPTT